MDDATGGIIIIIPIPPPPPPREPTILEMMLLISFFLRYGTRFTPGPNLMSYQLTDMPDSVNAYWMWMHTRTWD